MPPVGIAVVGAGPWGLTLARAFGRVEQARLLSLCELDDERRRQAAGAYPGTRTMARLEDVLADPEVEAVAVAVDSARHHPVAMQSLRANRHVFVEKPLALSTADAAELVTTAAERGRLLTVGHVLLHHPAVRRARQMVVDGVLGEPLYFESVRATPGPPRVPGSVWWALAPHDVSLALHLFGATPTSVSATGGAFTAREDDNAAFATLRFADGRLAHIDVARFAAEKRRHFTVAGTRRTLVFDELGGDRPLSIRESHTSDAAPAVAVPVDVVDPLFGQCLHFTSCIARGDIGGGNGGHALDVVRVLQAGAASMLAGGAPVDIP
jgi:predicted dehydrogenase